MTIHRIQIIETTTHRGSASFVIEATSAEMAGAQAMAAYQSAAVEGHNSLHLPDGQVAFIERDEVINVTVAITVLDEAGDVVREFDTATLRRSLG